jgi:hypothetical protein
MSDKLGAVMALPAKWRRQAEPLSRLSESNQIIAGWLQILADELEQALPEMEKLLTEARREEAEWWDAPRGRCLEDRQQRMADLRRVAGRGTR